MNSVPPLIETDRLILRKPQTNDAEQVYHSYASDKEVCKYLAWEPHSSIDESEKYIQTRIAQWESGEKYTWVVIKRSSNKLVGMYTFRWPLKFRSSISYVLSRNVWSKGYATELTEAVIEWVLSQPDIYRIEAFYDIENGVNSKY